MDIEEILKTEYSEEFDYKPTDSSESSGIVGMSVNEIKRYKEDTNE